MGANYDPKDQIITPTFKLTEAEEEMITILFDTHVDWYIYDFKERIKETKALKAICLIKTLVGIPEILISYVIFPQYARERVQCQKMYWKFLRNKLDLDEFKNELNSLVRNSKLG